MRKLIAVGLALLMTLGVTACGSEEITLTNEQNDLISEYIAGTMLKYSYDNQWKYQKLKNPHGTNNGSSSMVQPTTTAANNGNSTTTNNSNNSANSPGGSSTANPLTILPSSLGLSNVSISAKGISVGQSYPLEDYAISVPASSGYQVAAVEFNITNTSSDTISLNTAGSGVTMQLSVGGNTISQYVSILKNDICALRDISLASGEIYTAAALFQVEEGIASQISGSVLTISDGGKILGTLTVQ